jgi:putative peptidoglycan lipid II flippase
MSTDRSSGPRGTGGSAVLVAAGILCSRLSGLVRLRVFAHYFGLRSDAADAFNAAFRIPNFLQNLFGEGALSASFIPVYAALVARGERKDADRVAGAVAAILAVGVSAIVLVGVLLTPVLTALIAPGFTGAKRELTVTIVRILFPGAGLLVLSAWCLGVLNSHHRFLLSYAAPVMWNAAMIATLVAFGASTPAPDLAVALAWGSVAGSTLQLAVQLPSVLRVAPDLRFALDVGSGHVRTVSRTFVPVFISRGVVQVSAYIDALLASLLPTGAVTGLANAQLLYTLPVSLFGMSVAAAELPTMSGLSGGESAARLRDRVNTGLRRIAFFVVPSSMAFLALGDVVAAALLQTGRFERRDALYVWGILAGSGVGLLASTLGRLYASGYFALRDTKTPLRYAAVRVVLTTVLGYLFAIPLPRWLGLPPSWGAAGLTMSAGLAGWVEMWLLRATFNARVGETGLPLPLLGRLWTSAVLAAAVAWAVKLAMPTANPIIGAATILGPYGAVFFATAHWLGVAEASATLDRAVAALRSVSR